MTKKNSSSSSPYQITAPKPEILSDGRVALSFRDVLKNLVAQELNTKRSNIDPSSFTDKIKNSSANSFKHNKALSPKHRNRLMRQQKRLIGAS